MQLQDNDGNEYDVSLLRWGSDGRLGAEELDRAIDEELVGREGCEVTLNLKDDMRTLASLWYEKAGLPVVEAMLSRGLIANGHRFGEEAVALMRRHPSARIDAAIQCTHGEGGWLCVLRRVEVFALDGATDADIDCAIDLAQTFAGRDGEGHWKSQSANMSWFDKGVSACAYDWRGDTREELARAHEMDLPERKR